MFTGTLLVVFMHYGWSFFLNCCLGCLVISFCFWYVKLWLLIGRCILVLCIVARNNVKDKIISNIYLERGRRTRFPTFATEAQQWMARYESLAELFVYTALEMTNRLESELSGVIANINGCWYPVAYFLYSKKDRRLEVAEACKVEALCCYFRALCDRWLSPYCISCDKDPAEFNFIERYGMKISCVYAYST
ncbi:hypothetical protein BC941DRAFT_514330 [Chlamydoabsidia padenii]|nr:hypothetical protein BC941DRAFT_514330 [Chlamydoabsidia padenii]